MEKDFEYYLKKRADEFEAYMEAKCPAGKYRMVHDFSSELSYLLDKNNNIICSGVSGTFDFYAKFPRDYSDIRNEQCRINGGDHAWWLNPIYDWQPPGQISLNLK